MVYQLFSIISYPFQLVFMAPALLVGASNWFRGISLAFRVAVVVFLFMVLFVTFGALYQYLGFNQYSVVSGTWLRQSFLPLVVLTFLTPPVVYVAVKFWLEGHISRFPDIDTAWREGVAALEKEGISLANIPVFLILGSREEKYMRSLMRATGLKYTVQGEPQGANHPIHFYAAVDEKIAGSEEKLNAVFVFAVDACRTSRLNQMGLGESRSRIEPPRTERADMRGTLVAGDSSESRPSSDTGHSEPVKDMRGTSVGSGTNSGGGTTGTIAPRSQMVGTMVAAGSVSANTLLPDSSTFTTAVSVLSKQEANYQSARLEYLCHLISRSREPLAPLNGILTVTPFHLLRRGEGQCRELASAVREDLRVLQRSARLRCSVVSLIGGMEHEKGFQELVRRVGSSRARDQRLGASFKTWNPPTIKGLQQLARNACGAFEDNIYSLFKEEEGYNKAGNDKLYSLICKTRGSFIEGLEVFLTDGYAAQDIRDTDGNRPMLFSGCYFAATGETEGASGFIRSIFEQKLYLLEQDNLQWTESALKDDAWYHAWAKAGMVLSGALVLGLIVIFFVMRFQ
jgi:hypothetical protein